MKRTLIVLAAITFAVVACGQKNQNKNMEKKTIEQDAIVENELNTRDCEMDDVRYYQLLFHLCNLQQAKL